MSRPIQPTDEAAEQNKERVALWLDAEDLRWIPSIAAVRLTQM